MICSTLPHTHTHILHITPYHTIYHSTHAYHIIPYHFTHTQTSHYTPHTIHQAKTPFHSCTAHHTTWRETDTAQHATRQDRILLSTGKQMEKQCQVLHGSPRQSTADSLRCTSRHLQYKDKGVSYNLREMCSAQLLTFQRWSVSPIYHESHGVISPEGFPRTQ